MKFRRLNKKLMLGSLERIGDRRSPGLSNSFGIVVSLLLFSLQTYALPSKSLENSSPNGSFSPVALVESVEIQINDDALAQRGSMKQNQYEGVFITFEGGEGAGKTTLIDSIERQLISEGYSVVRTREPGGTKIGEEIRSILLHHNGPVSPYAELSLFLASRAQHIAEVIAPALKAGKVVLCDRFNDSSIAYQGAARGLGEGEVAQFCHYISQGLKPQITFYLDIDPEVGLSRAAKVGSHDRIESEAIAFHTKIREAYLAIQKADQKRFCLIDATLSPSQVFDEAMKTLHARLRIR